MTANVDVILSTAEPTLLADSAPRKIPLYQHVYFLATRETLPKGNDLSWLLLLRGNTHAYCHS